MAFDNVVRVYDKRMNLLAVFDGNTEGLSPEEMRNVMVAPTVHRETNGASTLSFQMLVNCEKWQIIKDPENIYELNDHYYTALSDGAYQYGGEGTARIVNVTLMETWYLLDKKYVQAYNCGLYVYAKATFDSYTTDGAIFKISSNNCSNPSNTISKALAWNQVKLWQPRDDDGNSLTYGVLKSEGYEPTNWENAPSGVAFTNFSVSGNTATVTITARAKTQKIETFEYSGTTYKLSAKPCPASVESVYVNTTITEEQLDEEGNVASVKYTTATKEAPYNYINLTGYLLLTYVPSKYETINSVIVSYNYSDLGDIGTGATCTFAYGAEVVDEHTFAILPKSNTKYKLTVNGVEYSDSQVKDARGVVMPRGSGGYAMWAALRDTGWSLGVCDVVAKGFDASIDYGCFNIESDMRDVLYIVQYIQELYGGILDFDSKNKVVNYRAENSQDYQAYNDGFNTWTGYEFREGKNMDDVPQITVDNELITRAYLLGYGNLNVADVNGGKTYIDNFSYTDAVYEGYLEQPLIYDTRDDGGKKQLLYWGRKELAKQSRPRTKITASVTDIRTAEGYEHEVFDLNDVARVYYRDSETGEEVYEEKRITLWEYNAFAMWDCTVELGDKTQNFSEVFKLIYNKAIQQAPPTNATGQISGDEVIIEIPNWGDLEFDIDISGGAGGYGYGGYGLATMNDYLELIVRKTTENTDAIAGLIIEANELYAATEQFSYFKKSTENMVSETYAGLKTYADGEIARVELIAEGYYDDAIEAIGGLRIEVHRDFVKTEVFAKYQKEIDDQFTQTEADLKLYADSESASAELLAKLTHVDEEGKQITSWADLKLYANKYFAYADLIASFDKENIKSLAELKLYADKNFAYAELAATFSENNINSYAGLKNWADTNYASSELVTQIKNATAGITVVAGSGFTGTRIYADSNHAGSYIWVTSGDIFISPGSNRTTYLDAKTHIYNLDVGNVVTSGSGGTGSCTINCSCSVGGGLDVSGAFYATGTTIYLGSDIGNVILGGSFVKWRSQQVVTDVYVGEDDDGNITTVAAPKQTIYYLSNA